MAIRRSLALSVMRSPERSMVTLWSAPVNRNGAIAPWIFEHVATVGGQHSVEAKPPCSVGEHARLITGRGGYDEDAFHLYGETASQKSKVKRKKCYRAEILLRQQLLTFDF